MKVQQILYLGPVISVEASQFVPVLAGQVCAWQVHVFVHVVSDLRSAVLDYVEQLPHPVEILCLRERVSLVALLLLLLTLLLLLL